MEVAIASLKGNFNKDIGQGVQKYIYNVWKHLIDINSPHKIEKLELGFGNGRVMRKLSFTLGEIYHDFSKYDIIHLPAPVALTPFRKGKATVLTTSHEFFLLDKDNPLASTPEAKNSFTAEIIFQMCRKQMLKSDYLLVDSTLIRDEAIKLGYDKDRIFLVNIGIDDDFLETPLAPKAEEDTFLVGRLGSFFYRKNVAFSIKAFRKIGDKDIRFDIWGKPNGNYDELVKLAAGDNRIAFRGFAPKDQLVNVYDSFDVYVHPILYTGFEMEILEAQVRGIPVIVSKKGQIPEEVRRYCFEAEDEEDMARIIKDIKDNGYDKKKQKEAMAYASQFTWKKTAEGTLAVYEKIYGKK